MLSTIQYACMSTIQRRTRQAQGGIEQIQKPTMVVKYNKHMGRVDQMDQMSSYCGFTHRLRTLKWWWWAFPHLFNVSILNAYILYQQQQVKKCTHEQFRIELARQLYLSSMEDKLKLNASISFITTEFTLANIMSPHRTSFSRENTRCKQWTSNTEPVSCVLLGMGRKRVTTTYRCKQRCGQYF